MIYQLSVKHFMKENICVKSIHCLILSVNEILIMVLSDASFLLFLQDIPYGLQYKCEIAKQPQNRNKNRYGNIVACQFFILFMGSVIS